MRDVASLHAEDYNPDRMGSEANNNVNYSDQLATSTESPKEQATTTEGEPLAPPAENLLPAGEVLVWKDRIKAALREAAETILLAAIIWLLVNFTTARYVVEGQSMEPNLHTGQYLIVNRLAYMQIGGFKFGSVHRGDIVVFDYPGNPSDDYVKRVIGLPGETVTIDQNGQVYIDGELLEEPYLGDEGGTPYRHRSGTWTVPEGSYFVLGDNRGSSSDSRSWGMLEQKYIVGKAWLSYWPPKYWGIIPHYSYNTP